MIETEPLMQQKHIAGIRTYFLNTDELPLVIEPIDGNASLSDLVNSLKQDNDSYRELLLKYGGLLFRGFPVTNEDDFATLIDGFGLGKFVDYIGGDSPRDKIKGGVYTSTEAPPSVKIPLHNELSFVKHYPKHIYFYCHIAPQQNGETIIADARKVLKSIDPAVRKRFQDKKIRYVSCYYSKSKVMDTLNKWQRSHKPWKDVFETMDKGEVERKCHKSEFEYKWFKNDWLQIAQTRPATLVHPTTKEEVWFNQAHLYDFNPRLLGLWRYVGAKLFYIRKHTRLHEVFYGDGSKIARKDLYHVMDALDRNTIYFPWKKGDVLVLDNVLAMHGRATFTGKRRILTAMTD